MGRCMWVSCGILLPRISNSDKRTAIPLCLFCLWSWVREIKINLTLCPVRTLRVTRLQRKRFFPPLVLSSKNEVFKNIYGILVCRHAGLDPPQAHNVHEIRALASTMASHSICSVVDVIRELFWWTDSMFKELLSTGFVSRRCGRHSSVRTACVCEIIDDAVDSKN